MVWYLLTSMIGDSLAGVDVAPSGSFWVFVCVTLFICSLVIDFYNLFPILPVTRFGECADHCYYYYHCCCYRVIIMLVLLKWVFSKLVRIHHGRVLSCWRYMTQWVGVMLHCLLAVRFVLVGHLMNWPMVSHWLTSDWPASLHDLTWSSACHVHGLGLVIDIRKSAAGSLWV